MEPPIPTADTATLIGRDLPPGTVESLAARYGLASGVAERPGAPSILLMPIASRDDVTAALSARHNGYIEVPGTDPSLHLPLLDRLRVGALQVGALVLSLTTASAFRLELAALVCTALTRRGLLPRGRGGDVELCLQEAVANALMHGNLAVEGRLRSDPDCYAEFCDTLDRRLRDPAFAMRRIDVLAQADRGRLAITVRDDGAGYDTAPPAPIAVHGALSGRGLALMRELSDGMTVSEGGRCVTLEFLA